MRMLLAVPVVVLSLVSCGSDSTDISPRAATELDVSVATIRSAIETGDGAGARALLQDLRLTVVELTTTGGITSDRALTINQAIATLEEELARAG